MAQWSVDSGRRLEFCRLTGDYNPLHLTSRYAHRMGFAAAFPHPQRVAAQCLGHLAATGAPPRELDLWIKGPAFFGRAVTLRQESHGDGEQDFALWVEGEERPALVGSLRGKCVASRLSVIASEAKQSRSAMQREPGLRRRCAASQ